MGVGIPKFTTLDHHNAEPLHIWQNWNLFCLTSPASQFQMPRWGSDCQWQGKARGCWFFLWIVPPGLLVSWTGTASKTPPWGLSQSSADQEECSLEKRFSTMKRKEGSVLLFNWFLFFYTGKLILEDTNWINKTLACRPWAAILHTSSLKLFDKRKK